MLIGGSFDLMRKTQIWCENSSVIVKYVLNPLFDSTTRSIDGAGCQYSSVDALIKPKSACDGWSRAVGGVGSYPAGYFCVVAESFS